MLFHTHKKNGGLYDPSLILWNVANESKVSVVHTHI